MTLKELGAIAVVGIGPGARETMTLEALAAIQAAEVVVGYKTYIALIEDLLTDQAVVQNGMRGEVERCQDAIGIAAEGKRVAVVSSGDAGVYGMAGLVLELIEDHVKAGGARIPVQIVPGVTASSAAAALLGAPLMHDYCHISLSDLLTPLTVIQNRLRHAALADFVICLYNPRSVGRPHHLEDAFGIVREAAGRDLPVAVVKDAYRTGQSVHRATLETLDYNLVDMTSMVIIGNSGTFHLDHVTITPRGYQQKGVGL